MNNQTIKRPGVTAHLHQISSGLIEVTYTGILTEKNLSQMRDLVIDATQGANGVVIRLDRALLATNVGGSSPRPNQRLSNAPAAFVVSAEQYDSAVAYSAAVAEFGIRRVVFLTSQIEQARAWAQRNSVAFA